jgi:hypothetical protein
MTLNDLCKEYENILRECSKEAFSNYDSEVEDSLDNTFETLVANKLVDDDLVTRRNTMTELEDLTGEIKATVMSVVDHLIEEFTLALSAHQTTIDILSFQGMTIELRDALFAIKVGVKKIEEQLVRKESNKGG